MSTTPIHARIDIEMKHNVEQVFNKLGLTTTDAIKLFFSQVILQQGIPFDVKIPNSETVQAIKEAGNNKNLSQPFHSIEALMEDI